MSEQEAPNCAACGGSLDPYKRYGKYKDFCSVSCRNAGRSFCKACDIPITPPKHGVKDFCSDKCTQRYRYTAVKISSSYLEERNRSVCKGCDKPIIQPKHGGRKQFCSKLCRERSYRARQRGEDITEEWGSYGPETRKILRELQSLRLDGTAKRLAIAIDHEYTRRKKGDPKGRFISFLCKSCGKEFRRRPWGYASKEYCSEKCQPSRYISSAVFTWDEVDEIRKIYADGGITYRALGEKYGVNRSTIAHIITYQTYKIEDDPRVKEVASDGAMHPLPDPRVKEVASDGAMHPLPTEDKQTL